MKSPERIRQQASGSGIVVEQLLAVVGIADSVDRSQSERHTDRSLAEVLECIAAVGVAVVGGCTGLRTDLEYTLLVVLALCSVSSDITEFAELY